MPDKLIPLSQIAEIIGGYAFKSSDFGKAGFPVVKIANIEPPTVNLASGERIPASKVTGLDKFRLNGRDIVMAMTGATIGKVGRIRSEETAYLNQRVAKISAKTGREYDDFVYAIVSQTGFDAAVLNNSNGSAQANISTDGIGKILIPDFQPTEQLQIGRIIGAIDDKIDLSRRMNETLEAIAKCIFKSWFVDASAGGLPEDWRESRLGDLADVNWGDTNTTKAAYSTEGFPAFSASGCDGLLPHHDFDRIGVVVSAIGANAGVTWLALGKWSCIKNTIRFWATEDEVSTEYLYYATLGKDKWPLRGSAQPFIAQGDARAMKIIVPSNQLAKRFGQIVEPFHLKISANNEESRTLATLRDALLPKLLSGEIRMHSSTTSA